MVSDEVGSNWHNNRCFDIERDNMSNQVSVSAKDLRAVCDGLDEAMSNYGGRNECPCCNMINGYHGSTCPYHTALRLLDQLEKGGG